MEADKPYLTMKGQWHQHILDSQQFQMKFVSDDISKKIDEK